MIRRSEVILKGDEFNLEGKVEVHYCKHFIGEDIDEVKLPELNSKSRLKVNYERYGNISIEVSEFQPLRNNRVFLLKGVSDKSYHKLVNSLEGGDYRLHIWVYDEGNYNLTLE